MSGGGKKNPVEQAVTASSGGGSFPGATGGPTFTMPAAMPGQLEAVANQLSAGFGQDPAGILSQMQTLYKPMILADYSPQAAKKKATTAKKATSSTAAKKPAGGVLSSSAPGKITVNNEYLSSTR